ncbi:MFS transporter [Actinomyces bowdenii]|uniref:MFS transporter n=1 Tax=Actinomyces bowdenii TaxID=131109 RepID=UPI001ABD0826|nr:MFS transporter [Actinomyces bowdenii]MBO3723793.1 MFS transporter [Actinomyces bowdenii]
MGLLINTGPLHESGPFARLWSAGVLLSVSAQMMQMAIAWTVYDETKSSLAVGGLGLAIGLPTLVFGLVGGALTDTCRPRRLGLVGAGGQVVVASALLVTTVLIGFSLILFYTALFAQSAFGAITSPTRRPYISHLLANSSIPAAMSLYMLSMNMGQIIGPILGGLLLDKSAIGLIFAIHATALIPYFLSIATLPNIEAASQERPGISVIVSGLKITWNMHDVRTVLLTDLLATSIALPTALLPALNEEILEGDATSYGSLLTTLSVGGLLGTIFSGQLERIRQPVKAVVTIACLWCAVVAILGMTSTLSVALAAILAMGALDVWSVIIQQTVVQVQTPAASLGRVGSVQNIISMAGPQLGNFRAGILGSLMGTQVAVIFSAAAGGLIIFGSFISSRKQVMAGGNS